MKRILFILAITFGGILASFFMDAFYGVLLYVFYSFASPLELTYGALLGARLSFMVAGVTVVTALMQRQKIMVMHIVTFLSLLFVFICYCSLANQLYVEPPSWELMYLHARMILMVLVTAALINSSYKLRMCILVTAVSTGILGAYYGFFGLMAGSTNIEGPGRFGDNNGYAVWLNASLPFIYYVGLQLKQRSWRFFSKVILIGNIIAVLLTFSRGGFITLIAILALGLLNIRKKILLFFIILVASIFIVFFAQGGYGPYEREKKFSDEEKRIPEEEVMVQKMSVLERTLYKYRKRIETLQKPKEQIASAVSRMHCWKIAVDIANAHPFLGIGFGRYKAEYDNYDTSHGEYGEARAVHNTSLAVLAETGYIGFYAFLFLFLTCLFITVRVQMRMRYFLDNALRREFKNYITIVRLTIVAYFLGGFFVTTYSHEILWFVLALSIAIDRISKTMLGQNFEEEQDSMTKYSQFFFGR